MGHLKGTAKGFSVIALGGLPALTPTFPKFLQQKLLEVTEGWGENSPSPGKTPDRFSSEV